MKPTTVVIPNSTRAAALSASCDSTSYNAIRSALFGVCLFLVQGLAFSQISVERAGTSICKSGAWVQLADKSWHVKAGMAQSPVKYQLPIADIARLERLADEAFDAAPVRARAVQMPSLKN